MAHADANLLLHLSSINFLLLNFILMLYSSNVGNNGLTTIGNDRSYIG